MFDCYSAARKVAKELSDGGYTELGTQIIEDLEGFSGTEIFMALRFHLQSFLDSDYACSADLRDQIRELVQELSRQLS